MLSQCRSIFRRPEPLGVAKRYVGARVPQVRKWIPLPLPTPAMIPQTSSTLPPLPPLEDSVEFLTRAGTPVRMSRAAPHDYNRVMEFVVREFHSREPISNYLKYTAAEFEEYVEPVVDEALKSPYSYIIWDQRTNIPCAMEISTVQKVRREVVEKIDCSTERLTILVGIVKFLETVTPHYIADGSEEFVRIELGACAKSHERTGLLKTLFLAGAKAVAADGITHMEAMCTALGSTLACRWLGMQSVYSIPYLPLTLRGTSIFPNPFYDGSTELNLMVGKTADALRLHNGEETNRKIKKSEKMNEETAPMSGF